VAFVNRKFIKKTKLTASLNLLFCRHRDDLSCFVIYTVAAEKQAKLNIFGEIFCIITGMRNRNVTAATKKTTNFPKMPLKFFFHNSSPVGVHVISQSMKKPAVKLCLLRSLYPAIEIKISFSFG